MKIAKSTPLLLLAGTSEAFLTTKPSFVEKVGKKEQPTNFVKLFSKNKPSNLGEEKNNVNINEHIHSPATKGMLAVSGTLLGLAIISQLGSISAEINQKTTDSVKPPAIERYHKCNEETDFCRYPAINIYHVSKDMTWERV